MNGLKTAVPPKSVAIHLLTEMEGKLPFRLKIHRLEYKWQGLTYRKLVPKHPVVHLLATVEPNAV